MMLSIADSLKAAFRGHTGQEQTELNETVFDLQTEPKATSLQFQCIEKVKDSNFWSMRAFREIRINFEKTENNFLLSNVRHHDKAHDWATHCRDRSSPFPSPSIVSFAVKVISQFEDDEMKAFAV